MRADHALGMIACFGTPDFVCIAVINRQRKIAEQMRVTSASACAIIAAAAASSH